MKILTVILTIFSSTAGAFWDGNNANWSPFGVGTGYNNQAPWGDNSNWNPFSATDGRWGPKNDAANLSRYGARPHALTQYKKNPRFQPNYAAPVFQNRVKPSNWLTETDFASTLRDIGKQNKDFIVGDDFSMFGLSADYARVKAETVGLGRMLRDYETSQPRQNIKTNSTDNIYGKQGYGLSPAASSTNRVNE